MISLLTAHFNSTDVTWQAQGFLQRNVILVDKYGAQVLVNVTGIVLGTYRGVNGRRKNAAVVIPIRSQEVAQILFQRRILFLQVQIHHKIHDISKLEFMRWKIVNHHAHKPKRGLGRLATLRGRLLQQHLQDIYLESTRIK